jgi:transcriptional regulator with XRE-family HTH domain
MSFGNKLRKRREDKGLTQEDVASFLGEEFSRQSVSKWELGASFPEVDNLLRISVALDISLDELLSEELKYYKKGTSQNLIEDDYPGLVAGLKTFAKALDKLRKEKFYE